MPRILESATDPVACRSGTDFGEAEPFGLVVALLECGAELVTATRWTLPTDLAFYGAASAADKTLTVPERAKEFYRAGPLNAAAHAVDRVQGTPDAIGALGDWQRNRLRDWKSEGKLVDSPIIWASIANYHAPYRTVDDHGSRM